MQPIVMDREGVVRFHPNKMVRFLYHWAKEHGMGLNEMAIMSFSDEDRAQFSQLTGYSVSGYGDLSWASPESVEKADAIADKLVKKANKKKPTK
jgi:hypothetical protein